MCIVRNLLLMTVACYLTSNAEASAFQGNADVIKRHLEAIKARGEPLTVDELKRRFPLEAGIDDVSSIWLEGFASLKKSTDFTFQSPVPTLALLDKREWPPPGAPWPAQEAVEQHLREQEFSLKRFHEAARRGGYGPSDVRPHVHPRDDPYFEYLSTGNLLGLEVLVRSRKDEPRACAESLTASLALSRICEKHHGLVWQLKCSTQESLSAEILAHVVCNARFSLDELNSFRAILRKRDPLQRQKMAHLGQRVISFIELRDRTITGLEAPQPSLLDSDWSLFFEITERVIANASKPFPDCLTQAEQLQKELESRIAQDAQSLSTVFLLRHLRSRSFWMAFHAFAQNETVNRAADTGIAIELYRRENGKLPTKLDDLVPKHLPSLPTDPFSGKPMLFRVEEKGFTIYSVGKNKIDDGGKLDSKTGDEGLFFPLK